MTMKKAQTQRKSQIRPTIEIIRMHDILDEILHNKEIHEAFDWGNSTEIQNQLVIIKRTLCWILRHDEGRWLAENMAKLEAVLAERGFTLQQIQ